MTFSTEKPVCRLAFRLEIQDKKPAVMSLTPALAVRVPVNGVLPVPVWLLIILGLFYIINVLADFK